MSKITSKMKRHVRHELREEGPTIWIGKEGLTPGVTTQVENQLQKIKMVKIRILKSALVSESAKTIANRTAEQLNAAIVEVRGHVFIIYRKRKNQTGAPTNAPSSP
ncbi:MAG: YhbY family RNA-binding protein [Crenarchaeota archaeon]|nr:YhbY family RNA-binding protein [Thermoproteota archaeon]